jgi:cytochrome P450
MQAFASIPRFVNSPALRADPLAFLQAARSAAAGIAVISEDGAIFSRASDCVGAVAVFGPAAVREVLNDAEIFGTVVSVAQLFALPPRLVRLNAGLFSMRGAQHRSRQQMLRSAIDADEARAHDRSIAQGWESFARDWQTGLDVSLLSEMRRLVLHVSQRIVFGYDDLAAGRLIQSYFDRRRALSGRKARPALAARRELIQTGGRIDRILRARLADLRQEIAAASDGSRCLLGRLANLVTDEGEPLSDDELIAHGNVLFMSSTEPVAVALTWTLLLLSQRPDLRVELHGELTARFGQDGVPEHVGDADLPLLAAVIRESLRLLPPNAVMVRLTTRPARLLGYELPAQCEVVLSPYVAHRDQQVFPDPDAFDPARWRDLQPPPYSYIPFGMGARYCLGRQLASRVLLSLLARILCRHAVVLSGEQELDWTINITMMPASDPVVTLLPPTQAGRAGGRLKGAVATLVRCKTSRQPGRARRTGESC